ncbi:histidinol-phosphatase HisJ family protein [Sporosarcina oncorhynchi]|uniref:Histidinol-phosphatase n=1 Tax=Sporosarcina oncorhynchi TaxID=3056444 RepID=A0ABZ0LA95_9BACL|nr:histidinol-phosphatase HisJ family protein [Sporosarcina sp. T2O-4]WOV88481.1 histidinol-phosphatase HisJ family protein [Sporosarcina sp. T2O-4]
MFDYHMHSSFSADCTIDMEDMVKAAIAKGLEEICFTEHIDYDYPDENFVFDFDKQKYDERIIALREKYAGRIRIKKGVEIGVQPHILGQYDALMEKESFDFIICSMHTVNRKGLHFGEIFEGRSVEQASQLYYDELLYCVKNYDNYSILGHIDLIKRYAPELVANDFHDVLREIFNVIIPAGKGIELNTSGVRYGLPNGLPSDDVLELYKQSGGEIITLGSDAHKPEDIAFQFKESRELLKSIGFNYVTTFEDRKPIFHSI